MFLLPISFVGTSLLMLVLSFGDGSSDDSFPCINITNVTIGHPVPIVSDISDKQVDYVVHNSITREKREIR